MLEWERLDCSPTLAAKERSRQLAAEGRRIYHMGLGQSPFPVPECLVDALVQHASERDYLPVRGLPRLRQAVAQYHQHRHGIARTQDDIVIGPGSKELMFLLQFCFDGELLIPAPAWVSYAPQARLSGRSVRFIATSVADGYLLDPDALDRLCRTTHARARLLVLNYPSNPTGCTYSASQLGRLADVCRRYGLIVLSDEIYGELCFDGAHHSLAEFYEEGTLVSTGLSKWCGAGGWRLGTFSFPVRLRWLADAIVAVGSETYSATSAPIQYAAVRAFLLGPDIEHYLRRARRVLHLLLSRSFSALRDAGLELPRPAGGFYLFPSFEPLRSRLSERGISNDIQLADHLLADVGISALPGRHFGMPGNSLCIRLALVDIDGEAALDAARSETADGDAEAWAHCARSVEAIEALVAWVRA